MQPGDAHTYAYTLTDCDIILPVHLLHGPSRSAPGALHFHDVDGRLHAEALMAIAGGNRVYASMGGDSRVHSVYGPLSLTGARQHANGEVRGEFTYTRGATGELLLPIWCHLPRQHTRPLLDHDPAQSSGKVHLVHQECKGILHAAILQSQGRATFECMPPETSLVRHLFERG